MPRPYCVILSPEFLVPELHSPWKEKATNGEKLLAERFMRDGPGAVASWQEVD